MFVVAAVDVRFFAPGTTPEMPLRAATCREAQGGHRPCEAAGHLSVPAASSCPGSGRRVASDARLMHLMWCRLPVVSGGQWRPGRSTGGYAVFKTCTILRRPCWNSSSARGEPRFRGSGELMMQHPLDPAVVFASVAQTRIRRVGRRQTCEEETMGRLPNRHRVLQVCCQTDTTRRRPG